MKRFCPICRRVVVCLIVACCLLMLGSCIQQPDVEFDTRLQFLSNTGASIFRVVYPQDGCAEGVQEAAEQVRYAMERVLRTEVSLVTDLGGVEAPDLFMPYEILIGRTARKETQQILSELGKDEWAVCRVGHKIVVVGDTTRATMEAVDHLIQNVIGYKGVSTIANPDLKIELNYDHRENYELAMIERVDASTMLPTAPYQTAVIYPISLPENASDALSLATLQGLAAAFTSEHIWIRDEAYELCRPYLLERKDLTVEEYDDVGKEWTMMHM